MPGWLVIVHVESGQMKSAELNSASGSFGDMLEGPESWVCCGSLFLERRFALEAEHKQTKITKIAAAAAAT